MPLKRARGAWAKNEERSFDELLAKPAVRLMMAKDRVKETEVSRIISEMRYRRGSRLQMRFHYRS